MKGLAVAGLAASLALGAGASWAAVKPANDVSIKMKISDTNTAGPLVTLTVKNLGTNPQNGVTVAVYAESEMGPALWSTTVDVLAGKSKVVPPQRILLDVDTTTLVARATLNGASDEDPTDNCARGCLGLKGKAGLVVVGRAIHLAHCASCHGDDAAGGSAPSLVGATSKAVLAKVALGAPHDFPWLSKTDAKNLGFFFKNPAGVVLPPSLPTPPLGGWPTYTGSVKALMDARCVACHGPGLVSKGVRLDTYNGASANARRSLQDVKSGKMPKSSKRFDSTEIALLQDWITGGRRP